MKRRYGFALLLFCVGLLFAGCGKEEAEDKPEEESIRVHGSARVGSYRGVTYTPYDTAVTEEEVQEQVDRFLAGQAELEEITTRDEVKDGDVVTIDYVGYMDGEAFENGADTGYDLEIGSGSFISGFESGLIGAKKGTEVDVEATFPDPYKNNPAFAGKTATFHVTIHKISRKVLPELTDELVAAHTEYATVQEYRDYLESSIRSQKESYAESYMKATVMSAVLESAEFTGIEQSDIDASYESAYTYYKNLAATFESYYGYSFSTFIYLYFNCASEEEYEAMLRVTAENDVKKALVLYYVIEQEGLTVTEEEFNEEVREYAVSYNMTEAEFLEQVSEEKIRELLLLEKAENLIYENAVAVGAQ